MLDIGCFHRGTPFAGNICTLSRAVVAVEGAAGGGLPVVVLQGSAGVVKDSGWRS